MLSKWTKILPFCIVERIALKQCQKNTLGGRSGVWAYRSAFLLANAETQPIDPATLRPDADLADLGRPMKYQLLPNDPVSNGPESGPHRQQNDRTP